MVDFRYHIVSLIAVFLALAVGIVLGAGPLRNTIADSLSGQVDQLRAEKDALRKELDTANLQLGEATTFIEGSQEALLTGVLPQYTVAVVTLPGADADVAAAVVADLEQAGATVTSYELGAKALDPKQVEFRSGIAARLAADMTPAPAADESSDTTIGAALGQALTGYDPANPAALSTQAQSLYQLLLKSELVTTEAAPSAPVQATVLIAPKAPVKDQQSVAAVRIVTGIAGTGKGSVLAGTDTAAGDLVRTVRADDTAAAKVTTVDSVDTVAGQVIAPRALALAIAGKPGSFGTAAGVDAVVPGNADLTEPAPIEPLAPTTPTDGATEGATDGATEGASTGSAG